MLSGRQQRSVHGRGTEGPRGRGARDRGRLPAGRDVGRLKGGALQISLGEYALQSKMESNFRPSRRVAAPVAMDYL